MDLRRSRPVPAAAVALLATGTLYTLSDALLPSAGAVPPSVRRRPAASPAQRRVDPRVKSLLDRVGRASRAARTMSADFTYSVNSVRRQQFIAGRVRMMKPNYARVTFSHLAEPAFPNLVASDGQRAYTFTPSSFRTDTRTFTPDPAFDPAAAARQASGLAAGGGTLRSEPVSPNGVDLRLWDGIPIQAFFDPTAALRYLYYSDPSELRYEGEQTVDGVRYRVLSHHFANGNIAGGERSPFDQRVYVGPDDLIHMYVLEFRSAGRPGVQVVRLRNVRVNAPMAPADFAFTPPAAQ